MEFRQFKYENTFSAQLRVRRLLWIVVQLILFRPTPSWGLHGWRRLLLRLFGANIGKGFRVASNCKIWAPWNLTAGDYVSLGDSVDCYSVSKIRLGNKVTVSQRTFLCTASHDIRSLKRPLIHAPIEIADHVWVCSETFVGPGVVLGEGAVVAARAVVVKDVQPWMVVGGNPSRYIKKRLLVDSTEFHNEQDSP